MPVGWIKGCISFRESAAVLPGTAALSHSTQFLYFLVNATKSNDQYISINGLCAVVFHAPHFFSALLCGEKLPVYRCRAPPPEIL